LGVILFGIVGALSLASIDSVPEDLIDNAAVLGTLCLLTALVFIGDLLMSPPRMKNKQDQARIIEKDLGMIIRKIIRLFFIKFDFNMVFIILFLNYFIFFLYFIKFGLKEN